MMDPTPADLPADAAHPPAPRHWPRPLVTLHWLTVALVVLVVVLALARQTIEARGLRDALLLTHRWCGLGIGLVCLVRLGLRWRLRSMVPRRAMHGPVAPGGARGANGVSGRLARGAASATHAALYLLLLALPALGWALSSARGQAMSLFGLALPLLGERDLDRADDLAQWHQTAAFVLMALVLLHAVAAVWHHLVRRDGVLLAMLPARPHGQSATAARGLPLPSPPPPTP